MERFTEVLKIRTYFYKKHKKVVYNLLRGFQQYFCICKYDDEALSRAPSRCNTVHSLDKVCFFIAQSHGNHEYQF